MTLPQLIKNKGRRLYTADPKNPGGYVGVTIHYIDEAKGKVRARKLNDTHARDYALKTALTWLARKPKPKPESKLGGMLDKNKRGGKGLNALLQGQRVEVIFSRQGKEHVASAGKNARTGKTKAEAIGNLIIHNPVFFNISIP